MDEYKDYLYEHMPKLNQISAGDLRGLQKHRQFLQCKSFKWFMERVAFDFLEIFPPHEPPDLAEGGLVSLRHANLCLDGSKFDVDRATSQQSALFSSCAPNLRYPYASQHWHLTFRNELRYRGHCLEVRDPAANATLWLWPCHYQGGNQFWFYDASTQTLMAMGNPTSSHRSRSERRQLCLEFVSNQETIRLTSDCKRTDNNRNLIQWQFGIISNKESRETSEN